MTSFSYFLFFAFLFSPKLSRASSSPGLSHPESDFDEYGLSRNPIREIYRRKSDTPDRHPIRRKNAPSDPPGNRFGSEIFDKLRNAGTQDPNPHGQDPNQGNERRGGFVSDDPKYLLEDTSSYQQAIKSLQQILKGVQQDTGSNDVYGKGGSNRERQPLRTKYLRRKRKLEGKREKRFGRTFRGYLDYTNSQMPFNEGTKRSLKVQEKSTESKGDGDESNYSRVRRYLDQERKRVKGSATLEAKEAAMSRVLDPNLNLDGILEPHVRKRRYSLGRGIRNNCLR